jgi:hypothetical protein
MPGYDELAVDIKSHKIRGLQWVCRIMRKTRPPKLCTSDWKTVVLVPKNKKGGKRCHNYRTTAPLSHSSEMNIGKSNFWNSRNYRSSDQ